MEVLLVIISGLVLGLSLKVRKLEKEIKELKNEFFNPYK